MSLSSKQEQGAHTHNLLSGSVIYNYHSTQLLVDASPKMLRQKKNATMQCNVLYFPLNFIAKSSTIAQCIAMLHTAQCTIAQCSAGWVQSQQEAVMGLAGAQWRVTKDSVAHYFTSSASQPSKNGPHKPQFSN